MAVDKHKESRDSVTKKWAILVGICTSPVFILGIYLGDPGRGQAAWLSAGMITVAARFLWDLKKHAWYWMTIVVIVFAHVPLILLVPWPDKQLSYVALLPFGLADLGIAYGTIRLVENTLERIHGRKQAQSERRE